MSGGGLMRIALTVLGRSIVELTFDTRPPVNDGPPHIEDHIGFVVGFVPQPPVPDAVDLPDRS